MSEVVVSQNHPDQSHEYEDERKPSFWQVVISVLAAALGVNSRKNQERDFQSSSPLPFIVGGLIFGVIFIVAVALVVAIVLNQAG